MLIWIREQSELASPVEAPESWTALGAATLPSEWVDSGCGAGPRVRWLSDGSIEVEGEGTPTKALPAAVKPWSSAIVASAAKYGVPPQWVAGHVASESGGLQGAHSYCCYGLMGLLPATATSMAGRSVSPAELLSDPELNIDLGTKLLGQLFAKYGGNPLKVAAAYNAGSPKCGAGKCAEPNRWNLVADCVGGKAVDYSGRVIAYSNGALGVVGGASAGVGGTQWTWGQIAIGALVVGVVGIALVKPELIRGVLR